MLLINPWTRTSGELTVVDEDCPGAKLELIYGPTNQLADYSCNNLSIELSRILRQHNGMGAVIQRVIVPWEGRNQGRGSAMLKAALTWLKENEVELAYTIAVPPSPEDQDRLEEWYYNHGFREECSSLPILSLTLMG